MDTDLRERHARALLRRVIAGCWVLALPALLSGCTCEAPPPTAPSDAGPLSTGIDAPGYAPWDAGPLPPEPCAGMVRRVRFALGDESLTYRLEVWGSADRALVGLDGVARLFDLEGEREVAVEGLPAEVEIHAAFGVEDGFEVLLAAASGARTFSIVHLDREGRVEPADPSELTLPTDAYHFQLVRASDGSYVGLGGVGPESSPTPRPAIVFVARPGAAPRTIDLGFALSTFHRSSVQLIDRVVVGVAYDDAAARVLRFEADLDTGDVRVATLLDGVGLSVQSGGFAREILVSASGGTAVAAVAHVPAGAPEDAIGVGELFWWQIGGELVTREVLPGDPELPLGFLGLAGHMPQQTLVAQRVRFPLAWVTAARIREPGDVAGGAGAIAVVDAPHGVSVWERTPGVLAVALLSSRELDVIYLCEGAP